VSEATIQGYQYHRWDRTVRPVRWIWPAIIFNEIRLALREAKTRTLMMTSGVLVLGAVGMFYFISLLETMIGQDGAREAFSFVKTMFGIDLTGLKVHEFRDALWRSSFLLMIKAQMFWVLIVVARVGAGLISKDLKARALPIYFAKPLTPLTYLLGKWGVIASFIALIMLIPNLLALALGTAITGGPGSWGKIASMAGGLLISGTVVCVVAGAVILALSSLSSDQRYVTVGWVAVCLLSIIAQEIINDALPAESSNTWLRAISLRDNIVMLSERALGVRQALEASALPGDQLSQALSRPMEPSNAIVLAVLTAVCILVAWRRVVRFSRSAATVQ
jgi:ABC-type transport system involved in multi-copper enzyme maturation permease subunit